MMIGTREDGRWPQRTWVLGLLGAILGWLVYLLAPNGWLFDGWVDRGHASAAWRLTLATWLIVAGVAFSITWTRHRPLWALGFAVVVGLVVGEVVAVGGGFPWDFLFGWRFFFAMLAVLIATPFLQHLRDTWQIGERPAFDYPRLHAAAWTDAVLIFSALLFVGLVWLLAWLLAGLFGLAGLDMLMRLLGRAGAFWVLSGGALGTGFGLLREREAILTALQRVVVLVFAAVAPVLGAGFAVFVLVLPFTGLHPLWQATKSTTPLLVTASAVAALLANAVIADRSDDEATNPILRWSAVLLALVLPVFGVIAAVSTGLRVRQYGLTPDRLWAITFTAVAMAYALGYLGSLVRGLRTRTSWMAHARRTNINLAVGLCALGLLLSTPLIDFGALAVRSQVARLAGGKVSADKFDWTALRFDFGPAGTTALKRLAASSDPAIRTRAGAALAAKDRWDFNREALPHAVYPLGPRLRRPAGAPPTDPALIAAIGKQALCTGPGRCFVRQTGPGEAVVVYEGATGAAGESSSPAGGASLYRRTPHGWDHFEWIGDGLQWGTAAQRARWKAAFDRGDFSLRPVQRRQLFVGPEPLGDAIDEADRNHGDREPPEVRLTM